MRWLLLLVLLLPLAASAQVPDTESLQINVTVVPQIEPSAGTERRCTELGSNCICGEPMNANSHDGGITSWADVDIPLSDNVFDLDDSQATECAPRLPGALSMCPTSGLQPVTKASQSAFLPAGNQLSWLMSRIGGGICGISDPNIYELPNMTYCERHYRRWGVGSYMPTISGEQLKILTIGGLGHPPGAADTIDTWQISMGDGGGIGTRFDGNYFAFDGPGYGGNTTLGHFNDCTTNFCRFEVCIDYNADGRAKTRHRMTEITPGSGEDHIVARPYAPTARSAMNFTFTSNNGNTFFSQGSYTQYSTHFLVGRTYPEDVNFWLGPACEVEGGCEEAPAGTYSTTFSGGNEYPISEGGRWVQNNPQGCPSQGVCSFNKIEILNGVAYQRLTPEWGHYDGAAHLTGFSADQWAQATYYVEPGHTFAAPGEGTLAVRMTTRTTNVSEANPLMEMYGLYYGIGGSPGAYTGNLGIGLWDGNSAQGGSALDVPPWSRTFYGRLTHQFSGPNPDCAGGPKPGDELRLTVQGQSPPRLNAYIRRNDGSPAWVRCLPGDVQDNGASSIVSLTQPEGDPHGPSWHTAFLTGDPGLSSFQNNESPRYKQGWTAFSAGQCPAWPASCAP